MAYSNGIISGEVHMSDIYAATGAPMYDGGHTAGKGAFRAMLQYINKWARCKPMGSIMLQRATPFGDFPEADKMAGYYGLTPPMSGYVQAADINSYEDWTDAGYTYDLDPMYYQYDRVLDWLGYGRYAVAPCSVAVTRNDTFCNEAPVGARFSVPPADGVSISVAHLGSQGSVTNLSNMYFCILLRAKNTEHWAMITAPYTIGQYYANGAGGTVSLLVEGTVLNDIRAQWDGNPSEFDWWICAASARCETLTEKTSAQLNDVGGIFFTALPVDNPTDMRGSAKYQYVDYLAKYIQVTIWGISWKMYWTPSDGLFPIATAINSGIQCGQMLADYLYGLAVGFTIHNSAPLDLGWSPSIDPSRLLQNAVLTASPNFHGTSAGQNNSVYGTRPVHQVPVQAVEVSSPATNTGLSGVAYPTQNLGPGQRAHFVAYNDTILGEPNYMTVATGQTIYPVIRVGLSNYSGTVDIIARN